MNGRTIRINRGGILILAVIALIVIYMYSSPASDNNNNNNNTKLSTSSTIYMGSLRFPDAINLRKLLISSIQSAQRGGMIILDVSNSRQLNQKSKGKTKEGADDPVTDADNRSHCIMKAGIHKQFPQIEIISEEDKESKCQIEDGDYDLDPTVLHDENNVIPDDMVLARDITVWIDPLDATQEFTEKLYEYVTTMVCVAVKGVPIIGVIHSPFSGKTSWAFVGNAISDDLKEIVKNDKFDSSPIITVSRSHAGDVKELSKSVFGQNSNILIAAGAGYKVLQVVHNNATAYLHSTRIKKWDICAGNAILNAVGGKMTDLDNNEIDYSSLGSPVNDNGLLGTRTLYNHNVYIKKLIEYRNLH